MKPLLLIALLALPAAAQGPTDPPPLLRIFRGGPTAPESLIGQYADASAPITVVGLTAITGLPECWLLEAHDSFASIEGADRAMRDAVVATMASGQSGQSPRAMIALYLPGLSYRPDLAIRGFPKARYFSVTIERIQPGMDGTFAQVIRMRRAAYERINLDMPELVYRVVSGESSGTYLLLAPMASLSAADNGLAKSANYIEVVTESGSPDLRNLAAQAEAYRENRLLRVEPAMSWVSDDWAGENKDFWHPSAEKQ